jgi:hypothetical protein
MTPEQMQRQRYVTMVRAMRGYLMGRLENGEYLVSITLHNTNTGAEEMLQPIDCDIRNPTTEECE